MFVTDLAGTGKEVMLSRNGGVSRHFPAFPSQTPNLFERNE